MGVVVAARHLQLDQLVALKLLDPASAQEPVVVERFLREARAAAKLRSDHVARVLDVGTLASGSPYMVMEHLDGADLGKVIDRSGPLDPETACDYLVQACEAVAEAHALGIVHRDLKPDNLYLTTRVGGEEMVKVLDFGISKVMSAQQGTLTQTRAVIGSPLYMAPEQLRSSRRADSRSDVWALGVVLYELLTRRLPFEAESLPDLCVKVASDPPRPIGDLRDDLPRGLVAVLDRCLTKDPAGRFANAAELAEALEPFAPVRAKPAIEGARKVLREMAVTQDAGEFVGTLVPERRREPASPRRKLTWIVAALALAVIGTSTGVTLARRAEKSPVMAVAAIDAAMTSWMIARTADVAQGAEIAPAPAVRPAPVLAPVPARATAPRVIVRYPTPTRSVVPSAKPVEDDIPAFR
jgi:serine/threonine-protein kinase